MARSMTADGFVKQHERVAFEDGEGRGGSGKDITLRENGSSRAQARVFSILSCH